MLGDEVSMTKITDRPDQAAVAAKVLDLDQRGAVHLDPVPPLDHDRARVPLGEDAYRAEPRLGDEMLRTDANQLRLLPARQRVLERGAGHSRNVIDAKHASDTCHGSELLHLSHETVGYVPAAQGELIQAPAFVDERNEPECPPLAQRNRSRAERTCDCN